MSPAATALYIGEQLRHLRSEISQLEQLADELVLIGQQSEEAVSQPGDNENDCAVIHKS